MAAQKQKIEFAAWEPDAAKLEGQAAHEAKNVLPSKRGYVPMPGLMRLTFAALPEAPIAVWTRKLSNDTSVIVAMTQGGIYSLENRVWVNKYTDAPVSVSTNRQIVNYGNDLYALWGTTLIKASLTSNGVGTFAAVSGAPLGNTLTVVQDFLCIGNLTEYSSGIHWSAIDDPTSWPAIGTTEAANKQSDRQIFPEGGKVLAVVGGLAAGKTGIVFMEHAIHLATYVGSPYIFQFSPIERGRGLLAARSPVITGSTCVFLAEDGFRITDGDTTKSIGAHRVDDWFFANCSANRLSDTIGVHDVERRLAWWTFASDVCPAGKFDRVIVYDYETDRWSWGAIDTELVFQDYGRGLTLEDLDDYGTLDTLPFASLDSAALKGGRPILGGFAHDHKLSIFNGANLEGIVTTQEIGGDRLMLHGLRPLVDCGSAVVMPVYRSRQMDAQRFGVYRPQQRDGVCYQHLSTVYASAQVKIPAGENWSHAVGVEFLIEQEGGM